MAKKLDTKTIVLVGIGVTVAGIAAYFAYTFLTKPPEAGTVCSPDGVQHTQVCPDGSTIVVSECVGGVWVDTGAECPVLECSPDGAQLQETCPDDSVIVTANCVDGKWVETGAVCPPVVDIGQLRVYQTQEPARSVGLIVHDSVGTIVIEASFGIDWAPLPPGTYYLTVLDEGGNGMLGLMDLPVTIAAGFTADVAVDLTLQVATITQYAM